MTRPHRVHPTVPGSLRVSAPQACLLGGLRLAGAALPLDRTPVWAGVCVKLGRALFKKMPGCWSASDCSWTRWSSRQVGCLLACLLASSLTRWLSCAFWCCRCGVGLHAHMSPCFLHTPSGNYRPALPGDGMKAGCQ